MPLDTEVLGISYDSAVQLYDIVNYLGGTYNYLYPRIPVKSSLNNGGVYYMIMMINSF